MVKELVLKNRSYRRFQEDAAIERHTLEELIELARLSPSGATRQPLKFFLSCDSATNARIFPHLAWAGYLRDWAGPTEGERPTGYIIILGDTTVQSTVNTSAKTDMGIAAQTIMLGAAERGLGGCMIGSIQRNDLRAALDIDKRYEIMLVLALGKPAETVVLETVGEDGSVKYWRDAEDVHHVPKRPLDDLIIDTRG